MEAVGFMGEGEAEEWSLERSAGPHHRQPWMPGHLGFILQAVRAREAFQQGSNVQRARNQDGKYVSSLSAIVSLKQNHLKALLNKHG